MVSPAPDRDPAPTTPPRRPRPALTVSAGVVSVVFTWAHDRWRHAIHVAGCVIAESVEDQGGDHASAWPASPPLVELSALETPRGTTVLGVGMAGRSHFSASVAPHDAEPDAVVLEIACRIKEPPGWLGSTYAQAGGRVQVVPPATGDQPPTTIRWAYTVRRAGIEPVMPATLRPAR